MANLSAGGAPVYRDSAGVLREIPGGTTAQVRWLLNTFNEALKKNPYQAPIMATPPTLAVSATTDAALTNAVALATGGALTAAAQNRVAWYGGKPFPVTTGSKYVALAVSSRSPSNGNMAGLAGTAGITADMDMWCNAAEIGTDAPVVEFGVLGHTLRPVLFQVDGEYVSKTGLVGASNSVDNFYKLTFATRQERRIRIGMAPHPANDSGGTTLFQIKTGPTASFWKPDQAQVVRMAWAGDSYGEGQPAAFAIPNAPMGQVAGELLGIRDVRQVSVGQTGYLADGGTRSKFRDQIPRWLNPTSALYQGPFDIIVVAHGYNDQATAGVGIQAEALACLRLIRSLAGGVPIVVLGSQAGARNPSFTSLHANTVAVENAIAAAVTEFADRLCAFAPVTTAPAPWLFGTGKVGTTNNSGNSDVYVDADGFHPSVAGHEALGFRAAAAIRAAVASMA